MLGKVSFGKQKHLKDIKPRKMNGGSLESYDLFLQVKSVENNLSGL